MGNNASKKKGAQSPSIPESLQTDQSIEAPSEPTDPSPNIEPSQSIDPPAEPVVENVEEPVEEPVIEPVVENVEEIVVEKVEETVVEKEVMEPMVEKVEVQDPVIQPVIEEPVQEPVSEKSEPIVEEERIEEPLVVNESVKLESNQVNEFIPLPFEKERRMTRAEVELLNIFATSPTSISDIPEYTDNNQMDESFYSQDLPKKSGKTTLRKKFYNTFSRKRSAKAADTMYGGEFATEKAGPSSAPVSPMNSGDAIPNRPPKKNTKYNTISMKMSTFRKKFYTTMAEEEANSRENTEASGSQTVDEAEKEEKEPKPKKKSFFSSDEFFNMGHLVSREVGHVFLMTGHGTYHF
eukprot:gene1151-1316_t